MVSRPDFDWKNVPFFPIKLTLHGTSASFHPETGEWQTIEIQSSEDSPELKRIQEDLNTLKIKSDIVLDMITARELDLGEASKLKSELEDLVSKGEA
ncbi:unnamed protein product [Blepharisma stoltei]|uniref:Uncharacterized protein n=1 Tax=Blepharisma stoltei TaxID=1481888 RepID=A0AAU9JLE1_9CILI|nr:unnamed protein product [Blepharisma stoltei]